MAEGLECEGIVYFSKYMSKDGLCNNSSSTFLCTENSIYFESVYNHPVSYTYNLDCELSTLSQCCMHIHTGKSTCYTQKDLMRDILPAQL